MLGEFQRYDVLVLCRAYSSSAADHLHCLWRPRWSSKRHASREGGAAWVVPLKESCFSRSMSVGTTIGSTRFRAATMQPSSAMYAEHPADTASANKKLITPRTKSDIPVAFLTFLFARLHVDDMLKTEGTQFAMFVLLAIWPSPPRERTFARRSGRAHTEATTHPVHSPPLGPFSHTAGDTATVMITMWLAGS